MAQYREKFTATTCDEIADKLQKFFMSPVRDTYSWIGFLHASVQSELYFASPRFVIAEDKTSIMIADPLMGSNTITICDNEVVEVCRGKIVIYEISDYMFGKAERIFDGHKAYRKHTFVHIPKLTDALIESSITSIVKYEISRATTPSYGNKLEHEIEYTIVSKILSIDHFGWTFNDFNTIRHVSLVKVGLPGDMTIEFDYHKFIDVSNYDENGSYPIKDAIMFKYCDNCNDIKYDGDIKKFIERLASIITLTRKQ